MGHIHNSGPPSRQLACCTHGRSHTRSPGVSVLRVNIMTTKIRICQYVSFIEPQKFDTANILSGLQYVLIFTLWNLHCHISITETDTQYAG